MKYTFKRSCKNPEFDRTPIVNGVNGASQDEINVVVDKVEIAHDWKRKKRVDKTFCIAWLIILIGGMVMGGIAHRRKKHFKAQEGLPLTPADLGPHYPKQIPGEPEISICPMPYEIEQKMKKEREQPFHVLNRLKKSERKSMELILKRNSRKLSSTVFPLVSDSFPKEKNDFNGYFRNEMKELKKHHSEHPHKNGHCKHHHGHHGKHHKGCKHHRGYTNPEKTVSTTNPAVFKPWTKEDTQAETEWNKICRKHKCGGKHCKYKGCQEHQERVKRMPIMCGTPLIPQVTKPWTLEDEEAEKIWNSRCRKHKCGGKHCENKGCRAHQERMTRRPKGNQHTPRWSVEDQKAEKVWNSRCRKHKCGGEHCKMKGCRDHQERMKRKPKFNKRYEHHPRNKEIHPVDPIKLPIEVRHPTDPLKPTKKTEETVRYAIDPLRTPDEEAETIEIVEESGDKNRVLQTGQLPQPTPEEPNPFGPDQPVVDPVEPEEPNPVNPGEPAIDPVEPEEPNPINPTDPVNPTEPEEPNPVNPPTDPVNPTGPEEPNPINPVVPVEPEEPNPVNPIEPSIDPPIPQESWLNGIPYKYIGQAKSLVEKQRDLDLMKFNIMFEKERFVTFLTVVNLTHKKCCSCCFVIWFLLPFFWCCLRKKCSRTKAEMINKLLKIENDIYFNRKGLSWSLDRNGKTLTLEEVTNTNSQPQFTNIPTLADYHRTQANNAQVVHPQPAPTGHPFGAPHLNLPTQPNYYYYPANNGYAAPQGPQTQYPGTLHTPRRINDDLDVSSAHLNTGDYQ